MNPILLVWKKRITYLAKLYYKFISFQVDGIILAYSLGLIGVLGLYFKEIILEIIGYISIGYMSIIPQTILILGLLWGSLTGYLKLADQVFLSPLNIDGKKFIGYSHILSRGLNVLLWFIIWTTLYFYYKVNFGATISIYMIGLVCGAVLKLSILNFKFILWNKQGKWKRRLYNVLFYSITSSVIGYVMPVLTKEYIPMFKILIYISSSIIILIISQLIYNDVLIDWERLINEETNKRVRNFTFLLRESSREKKSSRRKTIHIFSGRKILSFNPKGALLLLYFKVLQRGSGNLTLLLQMYFVILASIMFGDRLVISSGIIEIQVFIIISMIFTAYLVGAFLASLWINLREDVWFRIYPYSLKQKMQAIELGPTVVLIMFLLWVYIPISLLSGSVFNYIVDFIGIVILSIVVVKVHSYSIMSKLKMQ